LVIVAQFGAMIRAQTAAAGMLALLVASPTQAQTLKGSAAAMQKQHSVARQHDYTFLRTPRDVRRFVGLDLLVPVRGNADYAVASASYPYGRPALRTFVERLGAQYRSACGEKLVVTSLTRPVSAQPRNASDLSVHPAGMAVDLRRSRKSSCRKWLERTLLSLEKTGVLDATLERFPVHYHVALYPKPYERYVARIVSRDAPRVAAAATPAEPDVVQVAEATPEENVLEEYVVHRGDTLWSIARRHGSSVETLKELNHLESSRIAAGQVLTVPTIIQ
jgi:LysM repeat protein